MDTGDLIRRSDVIAAFKKIETPFLFKNSIAEEAINSIPPVNAQTNNEPLSKRANIEAREDGIYICDGNHHRSQDCEFYKLTNDEIVKMLTNNPDSIESTSEALPVGYIVPDYEQVMAVRNGHTLMAKNKTDLHSLAVFTSPPSTPAQVNDGYAWVVVTYENSNIKYRTMDSAGIDWTNNPNEAIRFCRRADAEMFAAGDEFSDLRIEQHKWG